MNRDKIHVTTGLSSAEARRRFTVYKFCGQCVENYARYIGASYTIIVRAIVHVHVAYMYTSHVHVFRQHVHSHKRAL